MRPLTPRGYLDAGVITLREWHVLELRTGRHQLSQRAAALALGVSRSTLRGLEERAWQKIHEHQREEAA